MADCNSRAPEMSDDTTEPEAWRRFSRALTTLRLGVPLLDEALNPAAGGSTDLLPHVQAAMLSAVSELGALTGQILNREIERTAAGDQPAPGALW